MYHLANREETLTQCFVSGIIEAEASCNGTLRFWADNALMFDSVRDYPMTDFVIPTSYKKLSVQCYLESPGSIHMNFSQSINGTWKCIQVCMNVIPW